MIYLAIMDLGTKWHGVCCLSTVLIHLVRKKFIPRSHFFVLGSQGTYKWDCKHLVIDG